MTTVQQHTEFLSAVRQTKPTSETHWAVRGKDTLGDVDSQAFALRFDNQDIEDTVSLFESSTESIVDTDCDVIKQVCDPLKVVVAALVLCLIG